MISTEFGKLPASPRGSLMTRRNLLQSHTPRYGLRGVYLLINQRENWTPTSLDFPMVISKLLNRQGNVTYKYSILFF